MKIGVFFPNSKIQDLDYSVPSKFNPGIAGLTFQIALLLEIYPKYYNNIIYQYSEVISKIQSNSNRVVIDENNAVDLAYQDDCEIYLTTSNITESALLRLEAYGLKTVIWGHNYYFIE
jgi:hypothetical protein